MKYNNILPLLKYFELKEIKTVKCKKKTVKSIRGDNVETSKSNNSFIFLLILTKNLHTDRTFKG